MGLETCVFEIIGQFFYSIDACDSWHAWICGAVSCIFAFL